jgi:hypothetical protein
MPAPDHLSRDRARGWRAGSEIDPFVMAITPGCDDRGAILARAGGKRLKLESKFGEFHHDRLGRVA